MTSPATYAKTLAALVVLLGAAWGSYYVTQGALALVVALVIAVAKAALVALFFMHLRTTSPRMRLFAGAGLVWLAILIGLTMSDFLTREPPAPLVRADVETSSSAER